MEIRQLRYFEAVARRQHFTHAARELHVAQSALSHQVRQLERELGIELLRRTTRSVELTQAGQLAAARARAVLGETEALRAEIDQLRGLVRGRLVVGAVLVGGRLDIPKLLASFTEAFPRVEVGVREGTAQRMLAMLRDGDLDLAFALECDPPDGIERLELSHEELVLVTSPANQLAGDSAIALTALAGQPLVAFERGSSTRQLVDGALAQAGVQPRIAVEGNDLALVRTLTARGLGVAILPRSFVELPGPPVSFRQLAPRFRMAVVLWWRSGRTLSPAARAFVEFAAAARPRTTPEPAATRELTPPAPRARRAQAQPRPARAPR